VPFRDQEMRERCVLCQNEGSDCANCGAVHCDQHLLEGSCTACHAILWKLERSRFHATSFAAGAAAVPAAGASLVLALSSVAVAPLGLVALCVIAATGLFLKKRLRPMIHNSLQGRELPPSSQRLLPAPPFEPTEEADANKKKARPRGLRRKARSRKAHFKFWNI
jgi:hypothetical protein